MRHYKKKIIASVLLILIVSDYLLHVLLLTIVFPLHCVAPTHMGMQVSRTTMCAEP